MLLGSNIALIGGNSTKAGSSYHALIKVAFSHDRGNVSNTKRADVVPEHVYVRIVSRSEPPAGIHPCGGQLATGSPAYRG